MLSDPEDTLADALVADLIEMDRVGAISLDAWPAARAFIEWWTGGDEVRPVEDVQIAGGVL